MAGSDCKYNTKLEITDFIGLKVRELLEIDTSEFDDPNWVQAAELFAEIIVPCNNYYTENLMALGFDIVKQAENSKYRASYSAVETEFIDYTEIVGSIKEWIRRGKGRI